MARLIFHCGLHKTGSTSLQYLLRENHANLPKGVIFVPRTETGALTDACRAFDPCDGGASWRAVKQATEAMLARLAPAPGQTLLFSSENYAGEMPSTRQARPIYGTAPRIAKALIAGAEGHEVTLVYYSRDRLGWLKSWHKHQLIWRATPVPWDDLVARPWVRDFDPDRVAEKVRANVSAPVIGLKLEDDIATGLGPGQSFLQVAGLGAEDLARLSPVRPRQLAPRPWVFRLVQSRLFNALPAGPRRWLKLQAVRLDRLVSRRHAG